MDVSIWLSFRIKTLHFRIKQKLLTAINKIKLKQQQQQQHPNKNKHGSWMLFI